MLGIFSLKLRQLLLQGYVHTRENKTKNCPKYLWCDIYVINSAQVILRNSHEATGNLAYVSSKTVYLCEVRKCLLNDCTYVL